MDFFWAAFETYSDNCRKMYELFQSNYQALLKGDNTWANWKLDVNNPQQYEDFYKKQLQPTYDKMMSLSSQLRECGENFSTDFKSLLEKQTASMKDLFVKINNDAKSGDFNAVFQSNLEAFQNLVFDMQNTFKKTNDSLNEVFSNVQNTQTVNQ